MVSIFHISNTNGGIGDPVVDLKHNSGERERKTCEGNERICLSHVSPHADYWLNTLGLILYKLLPRRKRWCDVIKYQRKIFFYKILSRYLDMFMFQIQKYLNVSLEWNDATFSLETDFLYNFVFLLPRHPQTRWHCPLLEPGNQIIKLSVGE